MTIVACALVATILLLILALYRQNGGHQRHVDRLLERFDQSQAVLLDRIQHPQIIQNPVVRDAWEAPVPPKDAAEMAMIGQIVPEFVHVGDDSPNGTQSS